MNRTIPTAIVSLIVCGTAFAAEPAGPQEDARLLVALIDRQYAYRERLPGHHFALTPDLRREAEAVRSKRALVRFAERALTLLADHHAITGASLADSWAVFPSYGDLWIERHGDQYVIEAVREGTPAAKAGVRSGDVLVAVDGVPTASAVSAFWGDLGATGGGARDGYAARVLAAGRRDRRRSLTVQHEAGEPRVLDLPNLYAKDTTERPPLTSSVEQGDLVIRFNDSLGNPNTIAAFDAAMAGAENRQPIILDLTDTPSGGNTSVARAIMGWFVTKPTDYQIHDLPVEQRETGIARRWIEQVLPRPGKHHASRVAVRVGRWTGSMGEGLAIGFAAVGARIEGSRMAGLLGAVYDHRLPASDVIVKLPTERLFTVDGTPREAFVPDLPKAPHGR